MNIAQHIVTLLKSRQNVSFRLLLIVLLLSSVLGASMPMRSEGASSASPVAAQAIPGTGSQKSSQILGATESPILPLPHNKATNLQSPPAGQTPPSPQARPLPPASESEDASQRPVNDIPPRPQGLGIYVNDYAGLLTPQDKALLQERLQALDEAGLAQISVLVLPNTDQDLSDFAPRIMNQWDIQHYKKKDGLLVLVNAHRLRHGLSGNRIFVGTGYNLEGQLPDALLGRVLDEQAIPAFERGDFSGGVTQATVTIAKILSGDKELRASYAKSDAEDPDAGLVLFLIILFFVVINIFRKGGRGGTGGFGGGGFSGGFGGGSDGGGFSGGFGGGGDSSGGGGAGR